MIITPCTLDPEAWFPDGNQDGAQERAECHTCPQRTPCAKAALDLKPPHGIWAAVHMNRDHQPRQQLRNIVKKATK